MTRTKEAAVSPRGFFGFIKLAVLAVIDVYNRGQPAPARRRGKWRCTICGRKYDTLEEIEACKARIHVDVDETPRPSLRDL